MIQKFNYPINRFALKLALFSLFFGILQVIVYAMYPNDTSINIGIIHLYPTVAIHTIVLLMVLVNGIKNRKDMGEHFLVILAMLFNIPLAIGCFYVVILITNL